MAKSLYVQTNFLLSSDTMMPEKTPSYMIQSQFFCLTWFMFLARELSDNFFSHLKIKSWSDKGSNMYIA